MVLPTWFGKSLCYQLLPLVFDMMPNSGGKAKAIVIVVSPLVALIKDQVSLPGVFTIIYAYYCRLFDVTTAEWLLVTFVWRVMITSNFVDVKLQLVYFTP